jgi:hypothetical protein
LRSYLSFNSPIVALSFWSLSVDATVNVPAGLFRHCLKTRETTPLELDALEAKYYAPGVGNVLTVDLRNGDKIKLLKIHPNFAESP